MRSCGQPAASALVATVAIAIAVATVLAGLFAPAAHAETWADDPATYSYTTTGYPVVDKLSTNPVVVLRNGTTNRVVRHDGTSWSFIVNELVGNQIDGVVSSANQFAALWWTGTQWDVQKSDWGMWTSISLPSAAGENSIAGRASLSGSYGSPLVARSVGTDVVVHRYAASTWSQVGTVLSPGTGTIERVEIFEGDVRVVAFVQDGNLHAYLWDGAAWVSLGIANDAPIATGSDFEIVATRTERFVAWMEDIGSGLTPTARVARNVVGTTWTQVLDEDDTYAATHSMLQMRLVGGRPVVMSRTLGIGPPGFGTGSNEIVVWEWWGSRMVRVARDPTITAPDVRYGQLTQLAGRPAIAYRLGSTALHLHVPSRGGSDTLNDAPVTVSGIGATASWTYESGDAACGGVQLGAASAPELVADDVDTASFTPQTCGAGDPYPSSYITSEVDPIGSEVEYRLPGIRHDVQQATDVTVRVAARDFNDMDAVELVIELRRADGTLLTSHTVPDVTATPTIYETPPITATRSDLLGARVSLIATDLGMSVPGTRVDVDSINLEYDAQTDWTARLRPNALVAGNGNTMAATATTTCESIGVPEPSHVAYDVETRPSGTCVDFTVSTTGITSDDVTLGFDTIALGGGVVTDVGLGLAASWDPTFSETDMAVMSGATNVAGCSDPLMANVYLKLYCGNAAPQSLSQAQLDAITFRAMKSNTPTAELFAMRALQLDVLVSAGGELGPPVAIRDGTGADVDGQTSTSTLQANWDAVVHDDFDEYEYCFTASSTGADCATTAHRTWFATSSTSASVGSLSLAGGSTHYACVRSVHLDTSQTAATCSDGVTVDTAPPGTPTLVSPANLANVAVAPVLTATYIDGQTSGRVEFQVCPTAACSSITATGTSAVVANGANGTWTSTAVGGTWFWRARNVDAAGSTSAWTSTWSYTFNAVPTVTQTSPLANAWVTSSQPSLQARHDDADGSNGTVTIETCLTNAASPWSATCGPTYQSMTTSAGAIASGAVATLQPNVALAQGTSYWRARTVDTGGTASAWSGSRAIQVDSIAPAPAPVVSFVRKGKGRVDVNWTSATDSGFGSVDYDVEVWNDTSGQWELLCTTVSLTCTKTGVGGDELLIARVRSCDGLNNCTAWVGGGVGANSGYIMRNVASANLGNAQSRAATLTGGAADTTSTSIAWGSGSALSRQGDFPFRYNTALGTKQTLDYAAPIDPQATPSGWGWVVDDVEGKWLPAGGMDVSVVTQQTAGVTGSVGILCRVWRVQTNGSNAMTTWTHIGDDVGSVANVLPGISGAMTSTCEFPNAFPTQTSFATDEVLYVEVVAQSATASNGDILRIHLNSSTGSTIDIPQPGLRPDVPLYVAPADTAWVPLAPTLTTTYQHPTPRSGSVQVQVATDLGFASIVGTYNTTQLAHGEDGSVTPTGLTPGVTYYWRARGIDSGSLVGGWTVPRTFRTNQPPVAPAPASPADGATVGPGPLALVAGAFSDPDTGSGDSHGGSQWQVIVSGGAWNDPVADSGIVAGTSWTGPSLVSNTYRWRVRYRDSLGAWSPWSVERTVTVNGGSTSIGVDDASVSLGLLYEGDDGFGSTSVTVASTSITGYTLSATDSSDTLAMSCVCGDTLPDWTGTGASPTTWAAGTSGHGGITVRDAPGGRLPKWGDGTATAETDTTANRYAGLASSVSTPLHSFGAPTTSDRITTTWRANFGPSEAIGTYSTTTVLTAIANP